MHWLDLFAIQRTLRSLLQHRSSKASILWRSAFFIVHLSCPYMTIGITIALTRQTFVDKVCPCFLICCLDWPSLVAPTGNRLPTMQETQVRSLRWEDTLEKEMATHSSILAWKIPWTEIWLATVHGVTKSRTRLSNFTRLVIAFLLRSKHLLISWLQSPSTVILDTPPKIQSLTVSMFSRL